MKRISLTPPILPEWVFRGHNCRRFSQLSDESMNAVTADMIGFSMVMYSLAYLYKESYWDVRIGINLYVKRIT